MNKLAYLLIAIFIAATFTSCAINSTLPKDKFISAGTLTTPDYQLRDHVEGKSCSGFYFWGLVGKKEGSYREAISNALKNGYDGIVHYKEDLSITWNALLCFLTWWMVCPNVNCVKVEGTAIEKFDSP